MSGISMSGRGRASHCLQAQVYPVPRERAQKLGVKKKDAIKLLRHEEAMATWSEMHAPLAPKYSHQGSHTTQGHAAGLRT